MSKTMKNFFAGILFLTMGVLILILLPTQIGGGGEYGEDVGPDYVPKAMATAMVILSGLLIIQCFMKQSFRQELIKFRPSLPPWEPLGVLALIIGWVFSLFYMDYLVVTIPFAVLALLMFRTKSKLNYGIAVVFILLLYALFRFMLHVRLP